jgi:hypothetical protein
MKKESPSSSHYPPVHQKQFFFYSSGYMSRYLEGRKADSQQANNK